MIGGSLRTQLPPEFVARTAALLGLDHEAFLSSLGDPGVWGARANPAKIKADELSSRLPFSTSDVAWCGDGLAFDADASLAGHPAFLAGLFHPQEPSAMAVVEALDAKPGWRVVDLAAAPGGRTTHLAATVGDTGLVVANEENPKRLRMLHDNLDLWGGNNVITTSRPLGELARLEGDGFDGVILDAPCSGEAYFRRDPAAVRGWSPAAVDDAVQRQRALLADAAVLVRPGGVLIYSTSSFGIEENEQQVAAFLGANHNWSLEDCSRLLVVDRGVPQPPYATELTARLWPHRVAGEGRFVARMRREPIGVRAVGSAIPARRRGDDAARLGRPERASRGSLGRRGPSEHEVLAGWDRFRRANLWTLHPSLDELRVIGDRLFALPSTARPTAEMPIMGLESQRPGLPLGRLKSGRFTPDPALATALTADDAVRVHRWSDDDPRLRAFLRGESLADDEGPDGWVLVAYEDWGLGWGHRKGARLTSHLPANRRRQARAGGRPSTSGP